MSEVKSARELAREIASSCLDFADPIMVVNTDRTSGIIQSDRRAIIDKCKEAVINQWCRNTGQNEMFNDAMIDANLRAIVFALDSVLSEIEKGE